MKARSIQVKRVGSTPQFTFTGLFLSPPVQCTYSPRGVNVDAMPRESRRLATSHNTRRAPTNSSRMQPEPPALRRAKITLLSMLCRVVLRALLYHRTNEKLSYLLLIVYSPFLPPLPPHPATKTQHTTHTQQNTTRQHGAAAAAGTTSPPRPRPRRRSRRRRSVSKSSWRRRTSSSARRTSWPSTASGSASTATTTPAASASVAR